MRSLRTATCPTASASCPPRSWPACFSAFAPWCLRCRRWPRWLTRSSREPPRTFGRWPVRWPRLCPTEATSHHEQSAEFGSRGVEGREADFAGGLIVGAAHGLVFAEVEGENGRVRGRGGGAGVHGASAS